MDTSSPSALETAAADYKQACEDTRNLNEQAVAAYQKWQALHDTLVAAEQREQAMREQLLRTIRG